MQLTDISSKSALLAPRFAMNENVAQTMTSREIAELVGSRHSDVMRTIDRLVEKSVISGCAPSAYTHEQNGQPYAQYLVCKRDSFIVVAQLCPEFTAALVDRWQELEGEHYTKSVVLPSFAETLRLYADQIEQTERVTVERDQAIATKALIGSKREATAMATASSAVREASKLRDQLGFTSRHATILHVEHATSGSYDFVGLRRWCKANGVSAEVVPDKRFPKGVKAWPAGAWLAVYGINLSALFGGVPA